jgi:hypothetical protein
MRHIDWRTGHWLSLQNLQIEESQEPSPEILDLVADLAG